MIEYFGWVAGCLTTVSFVPQVVLAYTNHDTRGVSIPMYVALCVGITFWLIYGILKMEPPIIATNAVTLAFAAAVLALTLRNRRRTARHTIINS